MMNSAGIQTIIFLRTFQKISVSHQKFGNLSILQLNYKMKPVKRIYDSFWRQNTDSLHHFEVNRVLKNLILDLFALRPTF